MTYAEFQSYMAHWGFTSTPITEDQYNICVRDGLDINAIYGVACDVNAGIRFSRALAVNMVTEPINHSVT